MKTINVLDIFEYFESAPVADVARVIKYVSRIVEARTGSSQKRVDKPPDENVRSRGGQVKPDSMRAKAETVLRDNGAPMTAAEIATGVRSRFNETVKRTSLLSILSRLAVKKDTFSRPEVGMYGLLEWKKVAGPPRDQGDNPASDDA